MVNQFGSLEGTLEGANTLTQKKRKENLINFADQARLSKQLAALEYNTPVDEKIVTFHIQPSDPEQLMGFLTQYGFRSLINRINKGATPLTLAEASTPIPHEGAATTPLKKVNSCVISSKKELESWLPSLMECRTLSLFNFSIKTTPIALCIAKSPQESCLIPWQTTDNTGEAQNQLFALETTTENEAETSAKSVNVADILPLLRPYLEHPSILKVGYSLKALMHQMKQEISPIDDIEALAYCLGGTKMSNDLLELIETELLEAPTAPALLADKKLNLSTLPLEDIADYSGTITARMLTLHPRLKTQLFNEKMIGLYETIDRPLIQTLYQMENNGIKVDPQILKQLTAEFTKEIDLLERKIHATAGKEFNIASPKQMGEILFDDMGIEGGKKTKTGAYKTDVDILQGLAAQGHTIADDILAWRSLSKLKNTYTDALMKDIHPETARIHTTYANTSTSTGRLSSLAPNLQNIPIRSEAGRKIRNAFIAKQGYSLIGADYSQIELRLLAHMANIPSLKQAFNENRDIHATTASQVFDTPLEAITPEQRRNAKAINFGIIYGQSAFGLANQLGISRGDAKNYIERYFAQYPGIRSFMEETKEYAREHGYVLTLFNRKCFIPGINASGPARAFAERAAINAPLQGTAADIIRKSMTQVEKSLKNHDAQTLLQVHDELIIEVISSQAAEIEKLIKRIMQDVIQLSIPLVVDSAIGQNWNEIH